LSRLSRNGQSAPTIERHRRSAASHLQVASYTAHAWHSRPGGRGRKVRDAGGGRVQVPAYVEYERATSVEHALTLLARFGPESRILAGGHSLIPMTKLCPPARMRDSGPNRASSRA